MSSEARYTLHFVIPDDYEPFLDARRITRSVVVDVSPEEQVLDVAAKIILDERLLKEDVYSPSESPKSAIYFSLLRPGVRSSDYSGTQDDVGVPYVFYSNPYDFGEGPEKREIHFVRGPLQSHPDACFQDVEEAVSSGYVSGQPDQIIIRLVPGMGGDVPPFDLVVWLLDQGVDVGLDIVAGYIGYRFLHPLAAKVRNGRADRRARRVAVDWSSKNLEAPSQLREWIESKSTWDPHEIAQRLRVNRAVAVQLLKALGYEENTLGEWSPGTSKKARRRHDRWLMKEFESPFEPESGWA